MAWADAVSAIKARFTANWSETPICYQNGEAADGGLFAPPPDGLSAWVYLEVLGAGGQLAGFGGGNHLLRHRGVIFVHVFVPVNSGTATAFTYADAVAAVFQATSFSGVRCSAASMDGGGSGDDKGNWFRVSVSVPFETDFFG